MSDILGVTIGVSKSDGSSVLISTSGSVLEQKNSIQNSTSHAETYRRVEVWSRDSGLVSCRDYEFVPNAGSDLTIKPADKTIEYGSTVTFTTDFNGLRSDDSSSSITGTATYVIKNGEGDTVSDASTASPGTYLVSVSGYSVDSLKYYERYESGTLTVTKKALTVTVDDQEIEAGDAAPSYTSTIEGFVNGEDATDLTGSIAYTVFDSDGETVADVTNATAGTYSIVASGYTSDNYAISYVAGTLTIT